MSDINLQLVREFFEVNLFHVLTFWQHHPAANVPGFDHGLLLFLENSQPVAPRQPDFVLQAPDVRSLRNAMVDIRAWHGDRFYPSVIENNPVLSNFVRDEMKLLAHNIFSTDEFSTILVISELPKTPEQRRKSIDLLKKTGIDHILEFPTIVEELLDKISENANYAMSETLQLLRLLKRYRFIRNQQMEFSFPLEPVRVVETPRVETTAPFDGEMNTDETDETEG